jgi:hypothetical protein
VTLGNLLLELEFWIAPRAIAIIPADKSAPNASIPSEVR